MYTGVSIFLIAVGAILTFATEFSVTGIDFDVVGVILMIVGLLGLIVDLAIWAPRRRRVVSGGTVVQDRRVYDDDPMV